MQSHSGEEKLPSKELTGLAYLQLQKGDPQGATEYFERAAEQARDEGDASTMMSCYLNAGACLVSRGQLQQGNKLLLSALKLVKTQKLKTNDGEGTMTEICADIYYNLAVAAQRMDKMKRAISYFKTSVELYLKSESVLHAADALTGLARCHRRAGQSEKEITCLVSAQQLFNQLGDSYKEAEVCLELARTYLMGESRMEDCKEMLSKAKLLCLRIDHRGLQGVVTMVTAEPHPLPE